MNPPNLLITLPHSGEWIPPEAPWLLTLPREVLLLDVDRFVDELYAPVISRLNLASVKTPVHRYAVDLNRYPDDVDSSTVVGAPLPPGTHPKGFHWAKSTREHPILSKPISMELHQKLVALYHDSFHREIEQTLNSLRLSKEIFHLDCHSMPSSGTAAHSDSGAKRADVVLSDFEGKSSRPDFLDCLKQSFESEGLSVSINWPYKGGRITQRYGNPARHHHTLQIELNRALYMNEETRKKIEPQFSKLQETLVLIVHSALQFAERYR